MRTSNRVKWLGSLLVVAGVGMLALMAGGVTYATWYSNHTLDTTVSAGVLHVTIHQPFVLTASNAYVTAEAAVDVPTQLAHFYAHNLAPGDYAIMGMKVVNTGSLPVMVGVDVLAPTALTATGFYSFNTLANGNELSIGPAMDGNVYHFAVVPNYSVTLESGQYVLAYFALGLYSDAPQSTMGAQFSVTYQITGMTIGGNGP